MRQNDQYFNQPVKSSNDDNGYDTLDVILKIAVKSFNVYTTV